MDRVHHGDMTRTTTAAATLADFLRTRRAEADPGALGVVSHGQRRVSGLRREELAELAGISLTYYTRLEQAAAAHPSGQILDALARALRLSAVERAHLHRIAGSVVPAQQEHRAARRQWCTLIDRMPDIAAVVLSPIQDVLAWNRLGHQLLAPQLDFAAPDVADDHGHRLNKVRLLFTDPATRSLHREWEREAVLAVASLRFVSGVRSGDPALQQLIGELSAASADFAQLWAEHPVELCSAGQKLLHHPEVGRLDLEYQMLHLPEEDGTRLMLMHAEPGSSSDQTLRLLQSLTISG